MLRATLKSLLARKLRLVLSGLAVVLGVMFVAGAFVVTDTLSRSFDSVFADAYSQTDVGISAKPKIAVVRDGRRGGRGAVPADRRRAGRRGAPASRRPPAWPAPTAPG